VCSINYFNKNLTYKMQETKDNSMFEFEAFRK